MTRKALMLSPLCFAGLGLVNRHADKRLVGAMTVVYG